MRRAFSIHFIAAGMARRIFSIGALHCLAFALSAQEEPVRMRASISADKVVVGETVTYTIEIESSGPVPVVPPDSPDFGGMEVVAGPRTSQRISIINGVQRAFYSHQFALTSSQPGTFVIPPISVTLDGRTFKTESYTVQVMPDSLDEFPPSLQKEAILNARSLDAGINQQLRGRVCVVPKVSDFEPFVGEPVVLKLILYMDPQLTPGVQDYGLIAPKSPALLAEEIPQVAGQKQFEPTMVDGRQYNAVAYYESILTPTEAGEAVVDGYGVRMQLLVRRRGGNDDLIGSSFFSNTIGVDALAGPVKLNVRPIPEEGRPPGFAGTVGAYRLEGSLDRTEATLDDIITLTVKLSGRGNIAQAAPLQLPNLGDFEVFDQTQETSKQATADGIAGIKTMEFLLRPKRAERLALPALDYVLFNPDTELFETLSVQPAAVSVAPGRSGVAAAPAEGDTPSAGREAGDGLRYIKPVLDVSIRPGRPLVESAAYWSLQFAALGIAGWAFVRARRRGLLDPVQLRRERAPEVMLAKLEVCAREKSSGRPDQAALALERAIREFVADLRNCSPEGLTAEEIMTHLRDEGVADDRAARVRSALDFCASLRYAPVGAAGDGLDRALRDVRSALLEPSDGAGQ